MPVEVVREQCTILALHRPTHTGFQALEVANTLLPHQCRVWCGLQVERIPGAITISMQTFTDKLLAKFSQASFHNTHVAWQQNAILLTNL